MKRFSLVIAFLYMFSTFTFCVMVGGLSIFAFSFLTWRWNSITFMLPILLKYTSFAMIGGFLLGGIVGGSENYD